MHRQSLEDLKLKIDTVVNEIDPDELADDYVRQFIEHHLLSLSLGAHTAQELIRSNCSNKEEELKSQKDLTVYNKLENTIGQKLNRFSTEDLYGQLIECKAILDASIQQ